MAVTRTGRGQGLLRVVVALTLIAILVLGAAGTAFGLIKVVKAVDGNKFQPIHKYITKGDKVRWKNVDNITHTVKATDKKKNWNYFRSLSPGETATRQFNNTGNYYYKCTLHAGMYGYIHVQSG